MFGKLRKHSRIITFIFALIMLAFIIQEVSVYFLNKRNREDDKGDIVFVNGQSIKYYEYKQRLDRIRAFLVNYYGLPDDSPVILSQKNSVIEEMISEIAYKQMAKNLHLEVSDEEAIELFNENKQKEMEFLSAREKNREKVREMVDREMLDVAASPMLSRYFLENEQQRKDNRNQTKIKKILENLSTYTKRENEDNIDRENISIDIDYIYVSQNGKDVEAEPTDEEYQEYLNKHFYKYREKEKYKIKYITIPFPISTEDKIENEKIINPLAKKFEVNTNEEFFAKLKSDELTGKDKKQNMLEVKEDKLPEVIKIKEKKEKGDVFIEIAKDTNGLNSIYKIIKKEKNKEGEMVYSLAVIHKKPFVSTKTQEECFKKIKTEVKIIKTTEQLESIAKEKGYEIQESTFLSNSERIPGFEDSRKIIVEINKKCSTVFGKDVFVVSPQKQQKNCIFGIVTEHIPNGTRKINDKIKNEIKNAVKAKKANGSLIKMLKEKELLDLNFTKLIEKAKNKDFKFLKYGSATVKYGPSKIAENVNINFKNICLLKEGDVSPFFETAKGIIKVKIKKINIEKKDKSYYEKTFSEKEKKNKEPDINKIFKKHFNVKNKINEIV